MYSFRDKNHRWDPKNQRPELWNIYNGKIDKGESIRVFPLSNWTELDIWQYIHLENIPIVPLYFAKERPVVNRDGMLIMVDDERMPIEPNEKVEMKMVRFRTLVITQKAPPVNYAPEIYIGIEIGYIAKETGISWKNEAEHISKMLLRRIKLRSA